MIDILFPRRCPVCDEVLKFGAGLICPDCRKKVLRVGSVSCRKCGKRLYDESLEYCEDCKREKHYFTKARSVFVYNDAMRNSVLRYKNHSRREYADFYAEMMEKYLGKEIKAFRADGMIAVPLTKKKLKKRGFDQAEFLAEKVSGRLGISLYKGFLKRLKDTDEQKLLSGAERRKNLKKAFIMSRNDVKLNRVILLDDVYTTGSTADEISVELLNAGIKSVMVVSLCSGTPI
ncbi:MAG: ComF family protein [Lachnospiraceae bacterium]|nr:ComF family protein [Lachnospiraceae bacterium]